jgi:hypothetical protein
MLKMRFSKGLVLSGHSGGRTLDEDGDWAKAIVSPLDVLLDNDPKRGSSASRECHSFPSTIPARLTMHED